MKDRQFQSGDTVFHFKRELMTEEERKNDPNRYLYEIVGEATDTESGQMCMVYRAKYGMGTLFVRPLALFLSEVDHEKYPQVKQKYRFEK